MSSEPQRVRVEELDLISIFPFVRLFRSFGMAIWPPGKLIVALAMVVVLYIGGGLISSFTGPVVYDGEIAAFAGRNPERFDAFVKNAESSLTNDLTALLEEIHLPDEAIGDIIDADDRHRRAHDAIEEHADEARNAAKDADASARIERELADRLDRLHHLHHAKQGVFEAAATFKLNAMARLAGNTMRGKLGLAGLLPGEPIDDDTAVGAAIDLGVHLPRWMFKRHPGFAITWIIFALIVWSIFGGTISRMAALHATRDEPGTIGEAFAFTRARLGTFLTAPLLPMLIALLLGVMIAVVGLLFNVPYLNVLPALLFGILLVLGLVVAMMTLLTVLGSGLFYPAIAIESTDAFEAVSRAGSYVFGKFWRWVFYSVVALVFGGIALGIVTFIVILTLRVTGQFAGLWVFGEIEGSPAFDRLVSGGRLFDSTSHATDGMSADERAATFMLGIWIRLCFGLIAAFAVSYFCCAQTWIYLLLRRAADGAALDEIESQPATLPNPDAAVETASETTDNPANAADQADV